MREKIVLPSKEALVQAMDVAKSSPEVATYLFNRFKAIVRQANVGNDADKVIEQLDTFEKYVHYQQTENKNAWSGRASEAMDTAFTKLQTNLAIEGAQFLDSKQNNSFEMHIAINDDGSVVRAYKEAPIAAEQQQIPGHDAVPAAGGLNAG